MCAVGRTIFATVNADLEQGISGVQKAETFCEASFVQQLAAQRSIRVQTAQKLRSTDARGHRHQFLKHVGGTYTCRGRVRGSLPDSAGQQVEQYLLGTGMCHIRGESAGKLTSGQHSSNAELSGVVQCPARLNDGCVARTETYGQRREMRWELQVFPAHPIPITLMKVRG